MDSPPRYYEVVPDINAIRQGIRSVVGRDGSASMHTITSTVRKEFFGTPPTVEAIEHEVEEMFHEGKLRYKGRL